LEKVNNTSLLAAAKEGESTFWIKEADEGKTLFGLALVDAFNHYKDESIDLEKLKAYVENWPRRSDFYGEIVYEMGEGDPYIFSGDKWTPVDFKTEDFVDLMQADPVPIPGSMLMLGSGLLGLSCLGLKRKSTLGGKT
jgi:hypothetical protein